MRTETGAKTGAGFKLSAMVALAAMALGGCTSNSLNGVPRLVGAAGNGSGIYGASGPIASCPENGAAASLNLVTDFVARACAAHNAPSDPALTALMVNSGVTLNRIRCADFFRQRGAGQTSGRIVRRTIAPLSALITGVLSIINFNTKEGQQEALEILSISSAALEGGLSVYEAEFLFDADNIRSVETLTMRDLDTHAQQILNRGSGFYQGLRDLLDHQALCRPTHILQLAQTAIREGNVVPRSNSVRVAVAAIASQDNDAVARMARSFGAQSLSADQVGALWWLATHPAGLSADELKLLNSRLGSDLSALLLVDTAGTLSISADGQSILQGLSAPIAALSDETRTLFMIRRNQLRMALARAAPPDPLVRTQDLHFSLSSAQQQQLNGGAVETRVVPNGG